MLTVFMTEHLTCHEKVDLFMVQKIGNSVLGLQTSVKSVLLELLQ